MARYASRNNEPLGRWNGLPIYLTTILTAVFVAGLIFCAVTGAMRSPLGAALAFTMPLVPAWSIWRVVTYVFLGQINFFTPFAILCFYWWSTGIESHLGRATLARLLAVLMIIGPVVSMLAWLVLRMPSATAGNYVFTCGLLVAFATLYPRAEAWGWIPFKWIAFACIACGSLMILADRDWLQLAQLWATCAAAFAFIRFAVETEYDDYESPFARLGNYWKARKFRVLPDPPRSAPRIETEVEDAVTADMDRLLDKIAKSGLSSLTPKERAELEKAREELLRRDSR